MIQYAITLARKIVEYCGQFYQDDDTSVFEVKTPIENLPKFLYLREHTKTLFLFALEVIYLYNQVIPPSQFLSDSVQRLITILQSTPEIKKGQILEDVQKLVLEREKQLKEATNKHSNGRRYRVCNT